MNIKRGTSHKAASRRINCRRIVQVLRVTRLISFSRGKEEKVPVNLLDFHRWRRWSPRVRRRPWSGAFTTGVKKKKKKKERNTKYIYIYISKTAERAMKQQKYFFHRMKKRKKKKKYPLWKCPSTWHHRHIAIFFSRFTAPLFAFYRATLLPTLTYIRVPGCCQWNLC